MNTIISIIIPIYNAEKTLHKCIDSILNQSYKDWELLLIDDGSNDQSAVICDEYLQQDKRIKVFHKFNGGVSSARNMGLDNAVGDWIMFIDSDDWIDGNLLGNLLPSSDIDFVLGYYVAEGWNEWVSEPYMDKVYHSQEMDVFLDECLLKSIFVWGKLFKRNIIEQNRLRFDVTISYSEDTIFIYRYIYYVKNVKTCSDAFYHYNCYASTLSNKYESWSVYNFIIKKQFEFINLLEKQFGWNGQVVYNITAYHFFSRYLYYTCCYCSVLSIKKELKMLLSNSIIRKAIKENNRRSWKGKLVDWLMLHDFLWLSVLLLYIKYRRF